MEPGRLKRRDVDDVVGYPTCVWLRLRGVRKQFKGANATTDAGENLRPYLARARFRISLQRTSRKYLLLTRRLPSENDF